MRINKPSSLKNNFLIEYNYDFNLENNFAPYILESSSNNSEVIVGHFQNISFIYFTKHRIVKWDTHQDIHLISTKLHSIFLSHRFSQDKLFHFLGAFDFCCPFPGELKPGCVGVNLTVLQGLQQRRKMGSEKEFLPMTIKKSLGQYDTPFWLAKRAVEQGMQNELNSKSTILDPMAGEGAFLEAAFHSSVMYKIDNLVKGKNIHLLLQKSNLRLGVLPKLMGIEIDPDRSAILSKNFSKIFQLHKMEIYSVGKTADFFKQKQSNFTNIDLVVSNPCWDVIEKNNAVRSRKKINSTNQKTSSSTYDLTSRRAEICDLYTKKYGINVSTKDARNIYSLTMIHSLNLFGSDTKMAFIVPKGILGDRTTKPIREMFHNKKSCVKIDEFKNKASDERIFTAVDARVQFCIFSNAPSVGNNASGLLSFVHEINYDPQRKPVFLSWSLLNTLSGEELTWLTVASDQERTLVSKINDFPKLSEHVGVDAFSGNSINKGKNGVEGKDIEMFRLRKIDFAARDSSPCLLVRKILPNGGKKLIAAPSFSVPHISDSLLCIKPSNSKDYGYYLSGVLNSTIGEYKVRVSQSNINLNLWRLLSLAVPVFDPTIKDHKAIVSLARSLEKKFEKSTYLQLDSAVAKIFGLTKDDLVSLTSRVQVVKEAA